MAKATIYDVAELAGVSMKTVSRVVNQEPNVRASTRAKVEAAVQKLQYRPSQSARSLASQRAHLIALIYDDPSAYEIPSSGYVIRMQQGTLRACRKANYELLIHPCNYRNKNLDTEIGALIDHAISTRRAVTCEVPGRFHKRIKGVRFALSCTIALRAAGFAPIGISLDR